MDSFNAPLQPANVEQGYPSNSILVYGLNVGGPEIAMLVRKVISLSIATAVVVVITTILGDVFFHYVSSGTFFSIVIGLLVPACGYYGAKNNDRSLIGMFCACGLCGAIWAIFQIMSGVGLVGFLKREARSECEEVTKDWDEAQYDDAKHLVDIAGWFIAGIICLALPAFILKCASFIYGFKLFNRMQNGAVIVVPPTNHGQTFPVAVQQQRQP
ncbi:hypothetical protein FOZ60_012967 [Perkinsus olseni]|uniref:Transmembrane protein n=1 Tax=Perkinsus olseni TaxID=32597 RepID=A0A7J6NA88_PEROL|nr:hypothetical protein FOZ60_012967 [Perkinsus olseni]